MWGNKLVGNLLISQNEKNTDKFIAQLFSNTIYN
jgi:hypothetical protein